MFFPVTIMDRAGYAALYQEILDYIDAYKLSNTLTEEEKLSELWLRGAMNVNLGSGAQSDFIRNYNHARIRNTHIYTVAVGAEELALARRMW